MTVEQLTQNSMANDKIVDLDGDGTNDTTANDAVPIYAKQAAEGLQQVFLITGKVLSLEHLGLGHLYVLDIRRHIHILYSAWIRISI